MQDYIAMTLILFSTEQNKNGDEIIKFQETIQKLKSLENLYKSIATNKNLLPRLSREISYY